MTPLPTLPGLYSMAKNIGGYCQRREQIILELTRMTQDEQMALNQDMRECVYVCQGYNYDCPRYKGQDINLKTQQWEDPRDEK